MRHHVRDHGAPPDDGFLEGAAGMSLVDAVSDTAVSPAQAAWDTCLLVG
jgi:hypothetical protein